MNEQMSNTELFYDAYSYVVGDGSDPDPISGDIHTFRLPSERRVVVGGVVLDTAQRSEALQDVGTRLDDRLMVLRAQVPDLGSDEDLTLDGIATDADYHALLRAREDVDAAYSLLTGEPRVTSDCGFGDDV